LRKKKEKKRGDQEDEMQVVDKIIFKDEYIKNATRMGHSIKSKALARVLVEHPRR
jgi:hypothetical protein